MRKSVPRQEHVDFLVNLGCDLNYAHEIATRMRRRFGVKKTSQLLIEFGRRGWDFFDLRSLSVNSRWKKDPNPEKVFQLEDRLADLGVSKKMITFALAEYYGEFEPEILVDNIKLLDSLGFNAELGAKLYPEALIADHAELCRRIERTKKFGYPCSLALQTFKKREMKHHPGAVEWWLKAKEDYMLEVSKIERRLQEQIEKLKKSAASKVDDMLNKANKCQSNAEYHQKLENIMKNE